MITAADFISAVRHLLDEQALITDVVLETKESLPVDERIRALAPAAYNAVKHALGWRHLSHIGFQPEEITSDGCSGHFELPDDFARLHTLKMYGWHKAVHHAISESDPEYAYQMVPATRGGCYSPVAAITDGGTVMRYFSIPAGREHILERMEYIARSTELAAETDDSPEAIETWQLVTARDVAHSFGRDCKWLDTRIQENLQRYGN